MLGRLSLIPERSLAGLIRGFDDPLFLIRPLNRVYYPLSYWLGGLEPWRYQLMYWAMDAAGAAFLALALSRASGERRLAALTGVLYALYPNHGGARFWNNQIHPAHFFYGAAMLAYALRLERASSARTAAVIVLLLLSGLNYEAFVPLCLLAPLLGVLRGRAPRAALRESWPVFAATAAVLAWSVLVQRLVSGVLPRALDFDARFALSVLGRGFECSTTAVLHLISKAAPRAARELGALVLAAPLAAAALALLLPARADAAGAPARRRAWLAGAVVLIAAGYLPYAFSADRYMPHIFDAQNRLNAASSLGAAMLLALGLHSLRRPRAAAAAVAAVLAAFFVVNWFTIREWREAWRLQRAALEGVRERLPAVGEGPAVILLDAPTHHGLSVAPVFPIDVEFDRALWVSVRGNLRGAVAADGALLKNLPPGLPRWRWTPASGEFVRLP